MQLVLLLLAPATVKETVPLDVLMSNACSEVTCHCCAAAWVRRRERNPRNLKVILFNRFIMKLNVGSSAEEDLFGEGGTKATCSKVSIDSPLSICRSSQSNHTRLWTIVSVLEWAFKVN